MIRKHIINPNDDTNAKKTIIILVNTYVMYNMRKFMLLLAHHICSYNAKKIILKINSLKFKTIICDTQNIYEEFDKITFEFDESHQSNINLFDDIIFDKDMIIFLVDYFGKKLCNGEQYIDKIIESKCFFKIFQCIDNNYDANHAINDRIEIIDIHNQIEWTTNIKYNHDAYKIILCPKSFYIENMCNKYDYNLPYHNKNVMICFDELCDTVNESPQSQLNDLIRCEINNGTHIDEYYVQHSETINIDNKQEQLKTCDDAATQINPHDVIDSLIKIMGLLICRQTKISNNDVINLSSCVSILLNCIKKCSDDSHNTNKIKCLANYMIASIKKQIISILVVEHKNKIDVIESLEYIHDKVLKHSNIRFMDRLINNKLQFDKDINEIENIIKDDVFIDALDKQSMLGDKMQESTSFYKSYMTLTDWHEETTEGGCMGLLFSMNVNESKILVHHNATTTVQNISTTIVPVKLFIDQLSSILKTMKNGNDLNAMEIIKCSVNGNGNCLYPLYITKQHWDISKKFIKPLLGINLGKNPYNYDPSYDHFMFSFLMSMLDMTLSVENVLSNDQRWIQMLLTVIRTCYQISIENNYNKGIIKLMDSYYKNDIDVHKKNFHDESFYGQIISTGIVFFSDKHMSKIKTIILNDYKNYIKKIIKKTLTDDDVYDIDTSYILDVTKCLSDERFIKIITSGYTKQITLINFYHFASMFNKFMKCHELKSWKIVVKMLDMRFGIFPQNLLRDLQIKINDTNKLIRKNLFKDDNIQLHNNFTKLFDDEINMHDIFVSCYTECYNLKVNKQLFSNKN